MTIKDISYFTRGTHQAGNESGRSLIEMLGTLGIITMITVGAIAGIGTGMTMWKANQTHEQIMELIQGITDMYSWNRHGWSVAKLDDQNKLCQDGGFSSCDDSGNIQFPLGNAVTITGDNEGTILTITVAGIDYKTAKYLEGKADGHMITDIECVPKCNDENRGARTLVFTHDSEASD